MTIESIIPLTFSISPGNAFTNIPRRTIPINSNNFWKIFPPVGFGTLSSILDPPKGENSNFLSSAPN